MWSSLADGMLQQLSALDSLLLYDFKRKQSSSKDCQQDIFGKITEDRVKITNWINWSVG